MDVQKCGACGDMLSEGAHCTSCNRLLHFHCAGITEGGHRKLGDRKLTWRCMKCKQTGAPQPASSPRSPRPEYEFDLMNEIRALSAKLSPLGGLKEEIVGLKSKFGDLESSLTKQFGDVVKEFGTKIKNMEKRIDELENVQDQVKTLQARVDRLEEESDRRDQWSRLNNVELKGIPQTGNENLYDLVAKVGAKINYPISKTQINFLTRVPSQQKESTKPIIVSFCNRYVKEDFVAAARYSSKTTPLTTGLIGLPGNQKIFVNDHLTVKNKLLLSKVKRTACESNFQYVWVKHSKIHARKVDASPIIIVKSEKDISKII